MNTTHSASTKIPEPTCAIIPTLTPQNPIPRTVVGYARVSTDLQREKESIRTQIECIEAECLKRGWRLEQVYCDDGVSGTLPTRSASGGRQAFSRCTRGQGLSAGGLQGRPHRQRCAGQRDGGASAAR